MAEEDTAAWDSTVQEWLVDTGNVWAGGVCSVANGCRFFGAATDQTDHPDGSWGGISKCGYQVEMIQEDGTTATVDCDEAETIRQAIIDGKAPNGVYLGGESYKLTEVKRDFEHNGHSYDIAILGKNKAGGFLVKTPNDSVAVALFDEDKNQNKVDALGAALTFADYLSNAGF